MNILFTLPFFPFPTSTAKNVYVVDVITVLKKDIIITMPPTTLYSPKSETPKASITNLAVKSPSSDVETKRINNTPVFLAINLFP